MFRSMMLMMMTVMRMIKIDDDLDDDIALPCLSLCYLGSQIQISIHRSFVGCFSYHDSDGDEKVNHNGQHIVRVPNLYFGIQYSWGT